ncbi:MAG TPA: hypothetical protein VL240_04645 [Candidatus Binatia bacterium]|nr:hypothetical protein [Candidatus Binatia bacterium]
MTGVTDAESPPQPVSEDRQMKFTITCQRAFIGNDIDVLVEAGSGELIFGVQCTWDDFEIGSDDLSDSRWFPITGSSARPAMPGRVLHTSCSSEFGERTDPPTRLGPRYGPIRGEAFVLRLILFPVAAAANAGPAILGSGGFSAFFPHPL